MTPWLQLQGNTGLHCLLEAAELFGMMDHTDHNPGVLNKGKGECPTSAICALTVKKAEL